MIDQLLGSVCAWARQADDVRGLVLGGSLAREDGTADLWSDLDLLLVTRAPDLYREPAFLAIFGDVLLRADEGAAQGPPAWSALYATGKLDLTVCEAPADSLAPCLAAPDHRRLFQRGFKVVLDKYPVRDHTPPAPAVPAAPDAAAFAALAEAFWMDTLRSARFVRRGDLWRAQTTLICKMRAKFTRMAEWQAQAADPATDTWYDGRFINSWLDPRAAVHLSDFFAPLEPQALACAHLAMAEAFGVLAEDCAARLGFTLPEGHVCAPDLLQRMLRV